MIVRILGDDQYHVADAEVAGLNELDDELQRAVDAGDERAFEAALAALLGRVRHVGTKLPADALTPSDALLPQDDAGLAEVAEALHEEGLIPG
ncbi:MAG: hypothetical protein J2P14_00540 [Acidothermales bacterium]|nr:hypothetical protein [Acidothermales bacterium]